jgi:hypothetical protein
VGRRYYKAEELSPCNYHFFVDQRPATNGSNPLFEILEGRWNGKIGASML